jgi:hypothetical protein
MKPAEASLPSDTEVLVKRSFDAPARLVWRAYMEEGMATGYGRLEALLASESQAK